MQGWIRQARPVHDRKRHICQLQTGKLQTGTASKKNQEKRIFLSYKPEPGRHQLRTVYSGARARSIIWAYIKLLESANLTAAFVPTPSLKIKANTPKLYHLNTVRHQKGGYTQTMMTPDTNKHPNTNRG